MITTDRTKVRRHAERGSVDRDAARAVLDEAYVAHVGFVVDGEPRVLPMTYGRIGDALYLHGAVANAMLRAADGEEVCVTVTLLDGLVLARSAFHHSLNYRCVLLLGRAQWVDDPVEKRAAFDALVEKVAFGRSEVARPATDGELRQTLVLRVPIDEASLKVRSGPPVDEPEDLALPVWGGVIPMRLTPDAPEPDGLGTHTGDLPEPVARQSVSGPGRRWGRP